MLIQERVSGPDVLLKLFVTIDDLLKHLHARLAHTQLSRDGRGGQRAQAKGGVVWEGGRDGAKRPVHCRPDGRTIRVGCCGPARRYRMLLLAATARAAVKGRAVSVLRTELTTTLLCTV